MRRESRKKETKKDDGRIQSEEYICYCVAVLALDGLRRRTNFPFSGFWWVKSAQASKELSSFSPPFILKWCIYSSVYTIKVPYKIEWLTLVPGAHHPESNYLDRMWRLDNKEEDEVRLLMLSCYVSWNEFQLQMIFSRSHTCLQTKLLHVSNMNVTS